MPERMKGPGEGIKPLAPGELPVVAVLPPELCWTLSQGLGGDDFLNLPLADFLQQYRVVLADGGWGLQDKQTEARHFPIQSVDREPITEKSLQELQDNLVKRGLPQLEVLDQRTKE